MISKVTYFYNFLVKEFFFSFADCRNENVFEVRMKSEKRKPLFGNLTCALEKNFITTF